MMPPIHPESLNLPIEKELSLTIARNQLKDNNVNPELIDMCVELMRQNMVLRQVIADMVKE
jgi:hypothetical protein